MSDLDLKGLLNKLNIKLIYLNIDSNGYLVRTHGKNYFFIKSSLSEDDAEKVILHELGHLLYDADNAAKYSTDYSSRLCCENGANSFLVSKKVKEYIALGNDAGSANYVNLANNLGIRNYLSVKKELEKYLSNS